MLNDLYATDLTITASQTAMTDTLVTLSDLSKIDSYWLGWMAWDNVPQCAKLSRPELTDTQLTFVDDRTRPENIDIGYGGQYSISLPGNLYDLYDTYFAANDNNTAVLWSSLPAECTVKCNAIRLYNRLDINTILLGAIDIIIAVFPHVEGGDSTGEIITVAQIRSAQFFSGSFSANAGSYGVYSGYNPLSSDLPISDSDIDGKMHTTTLDGYIVDYAVVGFRASGYFRGITTNGAVSDYYTPRTLMRLHDVNGRPYLLDLSSMTTGTHYLSWGVGGGYRITISTQSLTYDQGNDIFDTPYLDNNIIGGFVGSIDRDTIAGLLNNHNYAYNEDCNYLIQGTGRGYAMLRRIFGYDEILAMMALQARYGDSNTYDNGADKYYALVTEDNEFTGKLANGVTDRTKLRYWQLVGVAIDPDSAPYDVEDKPPYTPADDDAPSNVGASVLRPSTLGVGGTNGFITQYCLSAAQIGQLGKILWTSFLDPDYWRNYMFSLALDTGSFNLASLVDFFVSLRVYPFPLINVPSYSATADNKLYIGTGTQPLTIGTTSLHTINNYADYIDAGTCTIYSGYFRGDFRDYADVQISLYLPYCGTVQLNPGDVVGATLHAQYAVDFATGGCIAYVDVLTVDGIQYPIAALPGHIGADVPLTATNAGQVAARFAGDVINVASLIGGAASDQLGARASAAASVLTGGAEAAPRGVSSSLGTIIGGGPQTAIRGAQQAVNMLSRPSIGIPMLSGGRGFGSFGAPQTAYVQIRRAIYKQPTTYTHTIGSPSSKTVKINAAQGLISGIADVSGVPCTADEANQIAKMIADGIIV